MKKIMTICFLSLLITTFGGNALGSTLFTVPGDTFTVKAGFPWVLPETNFHYTITSNGIDGTEGVNAGDGLLNGLSPAESARLNIPSWQNFKSYSQVQLSGSIPANGLTLGDGASAGSWLTIGLISKNQAERAADWYMSGMFNNSVMVGFQNWAGQYSAFPEDKAGDGSTPVIVFDRTKTLNYEFTIDNLTNVANLRIENGSGWSSIASHSFGLDNWGWGGSYNDDLSQAAVIVQMYGDNGSSTTSATFGAITVTGVPEPATMLLLGLGLFGLAGLRKRFNH